MIIPSPIDSGYSSHYGNSMHIKFMREWGTYAAKTLVNEFFRKKGELYGKRPVLVHTGMSGICTVNAITAQLAPTYADRVITMYIRKEGESSHGIPIEWGCSRSVDSIDELTFILCDDFVAMGGTFTRMISTIRRKFMHKVRYDDIRVMLNRNDPDYLLRITDRLAMSKGAQYSIRTEIEENWASFVEEQKKMGMKFDKLT